MRLAFAATHPVETQDSETQILFRVYMSRDSRWNMIWRCLAALRPSLYSCVKAVHAVAALLVLYKVSFSLVSGLQEGLIGH